ncbi:TonB-dependent receptor [Silvibacterium sp.]|uniref:TonB-dependent receptor n=1 Tax=Silvibacterium sp. TaxID=1964179 RepID=UPI0039E34A9E
MKRPNHLRFFLVLVVGFLSSFAPGLLYGQSTSGLVTGTVKDPSGAAIVGATVQIQNVASGYTRDTITDQQGNYRFSNVPFNPYQVVVHARGFNVASEALDVSNPVPVVVPFSLTIGSSTEVTVKSGPEMVENDPTFHADIDRSLIDRLPTESASSSLISIVTLASPGVAADSNGLMHGLGDHAENSFSLDGQPITDQQSKVFSNEVPADAVQSMEVIDGAPPAEYGDKTSLVVKITTRSGQGVKTPTGDIRLSYGSFGTSHLGFNTAVGGDRWGNFITASGLESGRFLDGPEHAVFHDKGNEENVFDRLDYNFTPRDFIHINAQYTRSWFQTPNDFENLNVTDENGNVVGNTDQKSKIGTFNIAPDYTHLISDKTVFNLGFYVRRDAYNYYPSSNPLADFAVDQQQESIQQDRSLTNSGLHADVTSQQGINSIKFGAVYEQTFLRENDYIGIVDPTITPSCVDTTGAPVACTATGATANPNVNPILLPYDLTQGGNYYGWHGRADVKQLALYGEDEIKAGNWLFNLGLRGDFYNGLTTQRQAEPRAGISYNVKQTGTVLRVSYARTQETPFNENLVLSSNGCANTVLFNIFATLSDGACATDTPKATPFDPGFRNEFHAGFGQAIGSHFAFNGEYIWKYTHNAYDFSVLGTTPITFPIEWHNSKIPGYALSATLRDVHGLNATFNASSVAARFFTPQLGGVGATPYSTNTEAILPFRIDHDEKFNQTTHVEYHMPFRKSLWYGFNWRYDSGLVAGAAPCYNPNGANTDCDPSTAITMPNGQPGIDLSGLSYDQQFQAGLTCDGVAATPYKGFVSCDVAGLKSKLLSLPAPNTEDADKNPSRIAPRNLFDMSLGDENIYHLGSSGRYRFGATVTAINVTDKYALYNFLSTFSGTHYVTPRTITGELVFHF